MVTEAALTSCSQSKWRPGKATPITEVQQSMGATEVQGGSMQQRIGVTAVQGVQGAVQGVQRVEHVAPRYSARGRCSSAWVQ